MLAALILAPTLALAAGPELVVEFTSPSTGASYIPGQTRDVTVAIDNPGDADATSTVLALVLPGQASLQAHNCQSQSNDGSACGSFSSGAYRNGKIVAGGRLVITATVEFELAATGSKLIEASATAQGVALVSDTVEFTRTPPDSDLAVTATWVKVDPVAPGCPEDVANRYTPGCKAAYAVSVKNNGPDAVIGAMLDLVRQESPAAALNWTCQAVAGSGASCPGASGGALLAEVLPDLPAGGELIFSVTVAHPITDTFDKVGIGAQAAVPATWHDPVSGNNQASSVLRDRNPVADLAVTAQTVALTPVAAGCPDPDKTTHYTPGCAAAYSVTVTNNGPDAAGGARLSIARSEDAGAAFTWSCSGSGGAGCPPVTGPGPLADLAIPALPPNTSLTFAVTVNHAFTETHPQAGIDAAIAVPLSPDHFKDIVPGNNQASSAPRARHEVVDLEATVQALPINDPPGHCPGETDVYTPGCSTQYEVVIRNKGPIAADGASFSVAPLESSAVTVFWQCVASGTASCDEESGEDAIANLPIPEFAVGDTLTYTVAVLHPSSQVDPLAGLKASVVVPDPGNEPFDPLIGNNTAQAARSIDRRAVTRVEKRALQNDEPITSVFANVGFDYEIIVYNDGPSDLGNRVDGNGNPQIDPDGPALHLLDDLDPQLVGVNANGCNVQDDEPCWTFCESTLGASTEGAVVDLDACHEDFRSSGSGYRIDQRFSLQAGSASRLLTRVKVADASQNITITNTATIEISNCPSGATACDEVSDLSEAAEQSDSVDVLIQRASDLRSEVSNVTGPVATPGLEHEYLIVVENPAYFHQSQVLLDAVMPLASGSVVSGFVPGTVRHACRAYDGASCTLVGGGDNGQNDWTAWNWDDALSTQVNLPALGRVEFRVIGQVDPRAVDDMELAVTASSPDVDDVEARASTGMSPVIGLTLSKKLYRQEDLGNGRMRLFFEITAGNTGPSLAPQVKLEDSPATVSNPAHFDFDSAEWTCAAVPAPAPAIAPDATQCHANGASPHEGGIEDGDLLLDLMPGGKAVVRLEVDTTDSASDQVQNKAVVSHALGTREAVATATLRTHYDLSVSKTDGLTEAHPGERHSYSLTVTNAGPDDAYDIRVVDHMPAMLQDVSWTCSATSPVPGDLAALPENGDVGPETRPGFHQVISSDGRHIYVLGESGSNQPTVFVYARNATPGLGYGQLDPTPIDTEINGVDDPRDTGAAVAGMERPVDLILSRDGSVLYVLVSPDLAADPAAKAGIVVFHRVSDRLNPDFGKLSYAGSVALQLPVARRIALTATHLYVAGSVSVSGAGQLETLKPDPANQLPVTVGAVVDGPTAAGPIVIDPANRWLYVASTLNSQVRRYQIAASGAQIGRPTLDRQTAHDRSGYQGITDLLLAPEGRDVYARVSNGGSGGKIARLQSTPEQLDWVAAYASAPATLLDGAVRIAIAADGEHLFGVNAGLSTVFTLRRDVGSGDLGQTEQVMAANANELLGLSEASSVLGTPDGRHVLVTSASVSGPGPLMTLSRQAPAPQLGFIEMDRDGDPIGDTQDEIDSLVAPDDVVTRGRYVYVLSKVDAAITLFERRLINVGPEDEDGGHLSWRKSWRNGEDGITGMASPNRLLISPDGKSAFVSSVDNSSLAVFRRDPDSGELHFARSFAAAGNPGLSGAFGLAMDSDSRHLYVAGYYASAIAIFRHDSDDSQRLTYQGAAIAGQGGVTGLNGIRDLVVSSGGSRSQVIGVADSANTVVVFDRVDSGVDAGALNFVQALSLGANQRPVALTLSPDLDGSGNAHVYVAAQNAHAVHVLERVIHPGDPSYGTVRTLASVVAGADAPEAMRGPRDLSVSADGKRLYVAAEYGHSLAAFNRYDNVGSSFYGQLALAEIRTQDIDAVDGLRAPYAVAVSDDSRHVYVAGFDSDAVTSFSIGTGSFCSASGVGDIDDVVTIRAGGAVSYQINSRIRPDAVGVLENTATAFADGVTPQPGDTVPTGTDTTLLVTRAQLDLSKTNNQVAVMPGTEVTYVVTVRNNGPGNVVGSDDPAMAGVTDLFGCTADGDCSQSPFDVDTIEWTCSATGSGLLDFVAAYRDGQDGITGLRGLSSLALIPGDAQGTGDAVRGRFLVGASVEDNALVFFQRDAVNGQLTPYPAAQQVDGPGLPLLGARSVATSQDGRLLFVASRQSDSLNVFGLEGSDSQALIVTPLASVQNSTIAGLDKALHVVAVAAAAGVEHIYVAGANDHAVAAFRFDRASNTLEHVGSWVNNQGNVLGLADVEYLIASPDGAHIYAVSGSGASIAQFDRDPATGALGYRARYTGSALGVPMQGLAAGAFNAAGDTLYLVAADADRLIVLARDTGNGNLSLKGSLAQGEQDSQGLYRPRRILVSPDGQHLYVTSQAAGSIAWFAVDEASGLPKYLGARINQSSGISSLEGASGLVLDPELDQIYVAGTLARAVAQFQRESDSWCPASGSGVLQSVPVNIAAGGEVAFRIKARVSSNLGTSLINVADVTWQSAGCPLDVDSGALVCSDGDSDSDEISSVADLSITKDDGLAEFDGVAGAIALAADSRNLYVAAPDDNGIGMFRRQSGAPTGVGLRYLGVVRSNVAGVSGLSGVADLVTSGDGQHLYAVSPTDGTIVGFTRAAAQGRLDFIGKHQNGVLGVTGMAGARALALSPDGVHVYVAGGFANAIAIFRRQNEATAPDFGSLQFVTAVEAGVGGVNGIESPRALALSPDGAQLYVLGGSGTVVAFARQTNSGSGNYGRLTQVGRYQNGSGSVLGMDEVRSLVVTADGGHLYVLGAEAGSLVHFERDPNDGSLHFRPDPEAGGSLMVPELVGANRIRMGVDGRLYAAATEQDAVLVFELAADGSPALLDVVQQGQPVDGLRGVNDVATVADGPGWLYSAAGEDSAVSVFELAADPPSYAGSVFDGAGGIAPGDQVTYTIVVSNHGPSDVASARVADVFPPEFQDVHWTCSGYAGGSCPATGSGNIDQLVSLPNGGQVQFDATATVRAQATGRLVNTATVAGIDVLDPNLGNNSATDDDTVLTPSMDLAIGIEADVCEHSDPGCGLADTATPGGSIAYRVRASNAGPSYADVARVSDVLPVGLHDVTWTCSATPAAGLLSEQANMLQESSLDQGYRAMVIDPTGRHVYAVGPRNQGGTLQDAVMAAFARNALDGRLQRIPAHPANPEPGEEPDQGMAGARDLAISGDGRFVFVAGHDADAVVVFERDPANGSLRWRSMVRDSEHGITGIGGVSALALSPDGQHLYAAGAASQAVAGFAINPVDGSLSQVSVLRQSDGLNGLNDITDLAFDGGGGLLFASAGANRSVTALRRDAATGALAWVTAIEDGQVGVVASLQRPSALWIEAGRVFVADADGGAVNLMRFADGDEPRFELDAVIDLADTGAANQRPVALAYVADQARLYVGSAASNQLHLYSLLDETPEWIASYDTATSAALEQVSAFLVAPGGRELHLASGTQGRITTLAREPGSRCPLRGEGGIGTQTVSIAPGGEVSFDLIGHIFANATGTLDYAVLVDPRVLAQDPDFENNRATSRHDLMPEPDLEVAKLRQTPADEVVAGLPVNWWVDARNHGISDAEAAHLIDELPIFPGDGYGLVADSGQWSCSANLPLAPGTRLATADEPQLADLVALAASPDGRRWFAASSSRDAVVELRLDASGVIEEVLTRADPGAVAELAGLSSLALSPDGAYVYATASTVDQARNGWDLSEAERNGSSPFATVTGHLLVFALRDDGLEHVQTLTSGVDDVAGLRGARNVLSSADGRFIYVSAVPANRNQSAIAVFRRDDRTGVLSFVERIQDGLGTFGSASDVIRDQQRMILSADGSQLYTLARGSIAGHQTLGRFEVNPDTGRLRYLDVIRSSDIGAAGTIVPDLTGARDMVMSPGDQQLLVLTDQGFTHFDRHQDGSLGFIRSLPGVNPENARKLAIDALGSRIYVTEVDGSVQLYARHWGDGDLEARYRLDPVAPAPAGVLLHLEAPSELVLAHGGPDGGLVRLPDQALAKCHMISGANDDLPLTLDLGVQGEARLDYSATVHPSARGNLLNVARIEPGSGVDPDLANNSSQDDTPIHVISDLSISKTGPDTAVAGEFIEYEIRVENAGPSNALGIHVMDDLDPGLFVDASWTCAIEGEGDSACASASGSGAVLDAGADLHVGDVLVVTLTVRVHPAWLGGLQNAAYIVPEPGAVDPTPDDQVATPVQTEVVRRADLSVQKRTDSAEVVAGAGVDYTISVHNAGPSDAPDVRVQDLLPTGLRAATWACVAQQGRGDCGANQGVGSINRQVSIPVGETLIYTLHASLAPDAEGSLTNLATVTLLDDPAGDVADPDPDNNSASVTDPVLQRADLVLSVSAPDAYDPASPVAMAYRVDLHNAGPSDAGAGTLEINFSHPVRHTDARCTPALGSLLSCSFERIGAGASEVFELGLRELPAVPATLNSALTVGSLTEDPDPSSNSGTTSTVMRTGVDLAVSIDDGREALIPGDGTRYTITVRNLGSVDAIGASVLAPLASDLHSGSWQCSHSGGAYCSPSGSGGIDDEIDLPAGTSVTYLLQATLDENAGTVPPYWYEQGVGATVAPSQDEVNAANNAATDRNRIYRLIFRDGFEDGTGPRPVPLGLLGLPWFDLVPAPGAALPSHPARVPARRPSFNPEGRA